MSDEQNDDFGTWAILELLGHVKVAGYVTEQELFGSKIGRIEIPAGDGQETVTQFFGGQALYRLTPTTEELARAFARKHQPRPVQPWELPRPQREGQGPPVDADDDDVEFLDERPL